MSILRKLIAEIIDVEEMQISELERIVRDLRLRNPWSPTAVRFSGPFYLNADGEIVMSVQTLILGQPYTGSIVFTDATGATGKGPVGVISASDPSITVSLSADGQSYNVEMTTTLVDPATVTWSDPSGVLPSTTIEVTDAAALEPPPPFTATGVSLGELTPGTTA